MSLSRCLLPAAAAGSLLAAPAHAVLIDFVPAATTLAPGSSFSVDVVVGDLDATGETVSAFDLLIGYDSLILAPTVVALGPAADAVLQADALFVLGGTFDLGLALLGASGFGGGPLGLSALALSPPSPSAQADSVLLARLTFDALAEGSSALTFLGHPSFGSPLNVIGNDPQSTLVFDRIGGAAVEVIAVPEPGSLALLCTGLLLLVGGTRGRATRVR